MEEKLDVYDDIMVKKDYHENICSRYRIGRESIRSLLKNMKKDPSYLRKQNKKDQLKSRKERLIYEKIEHIYQNNSQLQSIKEMAEDM